MAPRTELGALDKLLVEFDQALRTLVPGSSHAQRPSPARKLGKQELGDPERKQAAALMRINHTGEVCAQALYRGQAATARLTEVRDAMDNAATEEVDHLAWCEERLEQLDSHASVFNPLWYSMSFGLGAAAGVVGDRWSLGFVAETEEQVCDHLEEHLDKLPEDDVRSRAILQQMLVDERQHGKSARQAGGAELPLPVRQAMLGMSRVMKRITYFV
ncbi:MAG: 2-polyprenyl-3-methyl-6-methoxy-1,4-benzoquinone monooxygenase [Pseudohongiellaceae bacterium]